MSRELDEKYYRILQKCLSSPEYVHTAINESTVSNLIVEQIDPGDISEVSKAIDLSRRTIDALVSYSRALNIDAELKDLFDYAEELDAALDKTQAALATVSFEQGAVMSFLGSKMTLPGLTSTAFILQTRAADFYNGFFRALENIKTNLIPVLKNADAATDDVLSSVAASNPDINLEKISKGITKELTKALGGTFFSKAKSFFQKKGFGSQAKILKTLPDRDLNQLAQTISNALLNANINNLLGKEVPKPNTKSTTDLADNMKDVAAAAPDGDTGEGEPDEVSDEVSDDLKASAQTAADDSVSPTDAVMDALDQWNSGLSPSSKETLGRNGRFAALKDGLRASLENSADAVQREVEDAIQAWRDENEEVLVKSKRFSAKNFDSLQNLVPKLAAHMLKKVGESSHRLTKNDVYRMTYACLDRVVKRKDRLDEEKSHQTKKIYGRWQKLAGM